MGFNSDLILCRGTRRERIMMLGNAVCPPVMKAAVEALVGGDLLGSKEGDSASYNETMPGRVR